MTVVRDLALAILLSLAAAAPIVWAAVGDEDDRGRRPSSAPCLFAFLSNVEGDRELDSLRRAGRRVSVVAPNWYAAEHAQPAVGGWQTGWACRCGRW